MSKKRAKIKTVDKSVLSEKHCNKSESFMKHHVTKRITMYRMLRMEKTEKPEVAFPTFDFSVFSLIVELLTHDLKYE